LTNVHRFENLLGWVPYPENDERERGKMIDRWSWWQRGEIFLRLWHVGQPVEKIKGEFCIWGKIFWRAHLNPVMDPKQKCFVNQLLLQIFVSGFEFCFGSNISKLEANLLQLSKIRNSKQICFNFWNLKVEAKMLRVSKFQTWSKFASTFEFLKVETKMLQLFKFLVFEQNCFNFLKFFEKFEIWIFFGSGKVEGWVPTALTLLQHFKILFAVHKSGRMSPNEIKQGSKWNMFCFCFRFRIKIGRSNF